MCRSHIHTISEEKANGEYRQDIPIRVNIYRNPNYAAFSGQLFELYKTAQVQRKFSTEVPKLANDYLIRDDNKTKLRDLQAGMEERFSAGHLSILIRYARLPYGHLTEVQFSALIEQDNLDTQIEKKYSEDIYQLFQNEGDPDTIIQYGSLLESYKIDLM